MMPAKRLAMATCSEFASATRDGERPLLQRIALARGTHRAQLACISMARGQLLTCLVMVPVQRPQRGALANGHLGACGAHGVRAAGSLRIAAYAGNPPELPKLGLMPGHWYRAVVASSWTAWMGVHWTGIETSRCGGQTLLWAASGTGP